MLVGVCQGLSLILSGLGIEEGLHLGYLCLRHLAAYLILCHHLDCLLKRGYATVVVVGPGECHVAQGRGLEAIAVALHLGLCPTSVVGVGESRLGIDFAVLEVVGALSHPLV